MVYSSKIRNRVTKPKQPELHPRFSWMGLAREVEFQRVRLGYTVKDMSDLTGISIDSWYKKGGGRKGRPPRTPFTVEELGRIAAVFKAPGLWPFEAWKYPNGNS